MQSGLVWQAWTIKLEQPLCVRIVAVPGGRRVIEARSDIAHQVILRHIESGQGASLLLKPTANTEVQRLIDDARLEAYLLMSHFFSAQDSGPCLGFEGYSLLALSRPGKSEDSVSALVSGSE